MLSFFQCQDNGSHSHAKTSLRSAILTLVRPWFFILSVVTCSHVNNRKSIMENLQTSQCLPCFNTSVSHLICEGPKLPDQPLTPQETLSREITTMDAEGRGHAPTSSSSRRSSATVSLCSFVTWQCLLALASPAEVREWGWGEPTVPIADNGV